MKKNAWLNQLLIILLISMMACVVILSLVPPVSRDALVHHLNVPKLYIEKGHIYELPYMPYSYFPMNVDLIYMIPLYFGNDIIPKLIHFAFALLTGGVIFGYLTRRLNRTYALFGTVFFLSIPIIIKLSITAYVDLGLILFSTASLLLLLKWMESDFKLRFLILSAVFCGLALGTKLNGLVGFFLMTLFVPFLFSRCAPKKRMNSARAVGYGLLFIAITLILFSPWMIRNYQWKGNPVYPLYDRWFNPSKTHTEETVPDKKLQDGPRSLFTYRAIVYGESWWQIALLPIRVFFEGKDGSAQYFDGKLNPFLLILPIFAFWGIRKDPLKIAREKKILLVFSVLFFAFTVFSTALRIRYFLPIVPPLVMLAVFGIQNIIRILKDMKSTIIRRAGSITFGFAMICLLAINALYILGQFQYVRPFQYLSGDLSRDAYIEKYCPEYPAFQYVNENLQMDSRLLFMFIGKRGYYCDRDYIPDTGAQVNRLYRLIMKSNGPSELLNGFREMNITHLIIHVGLFKKWANEVFDADKKALLSSLFKEHATPLYSKNDVVVFKLID